MDGKQKSFISYLIFGLSIVALIIVGYLLYQKFFTDKDQSSRYAHIKSKQERPTFQRPEEQKQKFARQKVITEKEVRGTWQAPMEGGKGFLELQNGTYRIFVVMAGAANTRYYSYGTYNIVEDVLVLQPNATKKPPNDKRYDYRILAQTKMPVMAVRVQDKMIWQIPSDEVRVYIPPRHAFFRRAKDDIAIWSPLK